MRNSLLILLVFVSAVAWGQEGPTEVRTLTLSECKEAAILNNVTIRNAHLDYLAAREQKRAAFTMYFPSIKLQAFGYYAFDPLLKIHLDDYLYPSGQSSTAAAIVDYFVERTGISTELSYLKEGYTAGLTATMPLYAGGRIRNGNRLARIGVEAAQLQSSLAQRKSLEEVEEQYWLVVSLEQKMKTTEQVMEFIAALEKDLESAVGAGVATQNDKLELRLKKNEILAAQSKVRGGIRLAKMNLCNSIGEPYSFFPLTSCDSIPYIDDIMIEGTLVEQNPDMFYKDEFEILAAREENLLLGKAVQAGIMQKRMTRGEVLPQLAVGATYGNGKLVTDPSFNVVAFVSLSVPLTDWWQYSHKIKQADYQLQKAVNEQDYLTDQLLLQIRQYWLEVTTSYEAVLLAREAVDIASVALETARSQYLAGLVTLSEVLQAQTALSAKVDSLLDAQIAHRTALSAYQSLAE